jgi:hypothetical protein
MSDEWEQTRRMQSLLDAAYGQAKLWNWALVVATLLASVACFSHYTATGVALSVMSLLFNALGFRAMRAANRIEELRLARLNAEAERLFANLERDG